MNYPTTHTLNHPKSKHPNSKNNFIHAHVLLAEKVLGKYLPQKTVIHHFPAYENAIHVVICQNQAYHILLHQRYRALIACGDPNWKKCCYCKKYDDPQNLIIKVSNGHTGYEHRPCKLEYLKKYRGIHEAHNLG